MEAKLKLSTGGLTADELGALRSGFNEYKGVIAEKLKWA
jgi:hypothetical protein